MRGHSNSPDHPIALVGKNIEASGPSSPPSPSPSSTVGLEWALPQTPTPSRPAWPSTQYTPIHARLHSRTGCESDASTWAVVCRPSTRCSLGMFVIITDLASQRTIQGRIEGVRALEKEWIEFCIKGPASTDSALLCVPVRWASLPWHAHLFQLLCHPWLSKTTPMIPPG